MSDTIELHVDGDVVHIDVDTLSSLEVFQWAAKAPDVMKQGETTIQATEEVLEFLVDLTTSQTILTRELLNQLPQEELSILFAGVVDLAFNEDAEFSRERVDSSQDPKAVEWEDGGLDLDEWR